MPYRFKPEAVLFDLYSTLVDIRTDERDPLVWMRLAYFLRSRGVHGVVPAELSRAFFERSQRWQEQRGSTETHPEVDVLAVFQEVLAEIAEVPFERSFVTEVTQLFRLLSLRHLDLFPDTLPTLEALRPHFKLGLVSNAQRVFLEPELAALGLPKWLQVTVISSDHGYQKPDRRLFEIALGRLGVTASEAVFVGDTVSRDVCGAREAGIFAILLDREERVQRFDDTCEPNLILASLDELRWWLFGAAGV